MIRLSILVAALGIVGTAAALIGTNEPDDSAALVALLYVVLTPPAIVSGVIKHFREEGGVTLQTMFGVLCLYLLVGLLFGVGFVAIQEPLDGPSSPRASVSGMTSSTSATPP